MSVIIAVPTLAIAALLISAASYAADVTVTCNTEQCTASPSDTPLFQEENWVPGQGATKQIAFQNNRSEDCTAQLSATGVSQSPEDFPSILHTVIRKGETNWYTGTLAELYGNQVSLDTLSAGTSATYDWSIMFDPAAGNEYQGAEMSFDFATNFACPTVTSTPTPTPESDIDIVGTALGDETVREPGISPRVLAAAVGPEEDEKPKPSVLGLADTGHTNYVLWYVVASAIVIGISYALDRKQNRSVR